MKLLNQSKLGLLAILALGITLTSCKKLDNLVQVNLELQMAQVPFTIEPSPAGNTTTTGITHYDVDSAIKASNASFGVGNIKSAKIDSVVITLTDSTFAGVTNTQASFHSDADTSTILIAGNTNSSASSSLTLQPSTTLDLTNYIKATSFTYVFSSTHPAINSPIQANAAVYFHLVVGPN
ncbi:MAG TPA: hypothetical protein VK705_04750 [Ferruginibacter sp.]|jgi:hypothetical protein|nr:hypothetical protein [Ferruginibacter sp.]